MPSLPSSADRLFSAAVRINGEHNSSLYQCVQTITVDEDLDVGSSFSIQLNACRNDDGSYPYVEDENLRVWNRVTIYAVFPQQTEVVMDGYISNVGISTNPETSNVTVEIRGVDPSFEMNLEDKSRVWSGQSYEQIAETIIATYGLTPIVATPADSSSNADSPPSSVAQRGSDLRFLRELARRKGYEFFVQGGNAYFRPAQLTGTPQKLIVANFGEETNCTSISVQTDGTAPTEVAFDFIDAMTGQVTSVEHTDAGLPVLGTSPLASLRGSAGMPQTRSTPRRLGCLTQAQADDYAIGILRRNAWWVVATGRLNGLRYGRVLRSRKLVNVKGFGASYNGTYYVRKVRHQLTMNTYDMDFELVRNAIGQLGSEDFAGEHPDSAASPAAAGAGADSDTVRVVETGSRVLSA